ASAFTNTYDLVQRGRTLTLRHAVADQTGDIAASVGIWRDVAGTQPFSTGTANIRSQIVFAADDGDDIAEDGEWNFPQTVTLQAIDDTFIDGGDALVFPAFEERLNEIRGPVTIQGGPLVGEERFLNDPFRLPEETNDRQADGQLDDAITNLDGQAVLVDREAFHFNALLGERPGFDPRMNSFPFEFTFLNGPAIASFLDVQSVSQELLSVADDRPFDVDLSISGVSDLASRVMFSGTPEQERDADDHITVTNADLEWIEALVSLTGSSVQGETWTVTLTKGGNSYVFSYEVTAGNRALSKIGRELARQINATLGFAAEAFVDIVGNSKIRVRTTDGVAFKVAADIGGLGNAIISGRPVQDFAEILDDTQWTVAAFEILAVNASETWSLTLQSTEAGAVPDTSTYTIAAGDTIEDLTFELSDRISTDFLPLVSGYTVTFQTAWTSEATSTVVLSGQPADGEIWSLTLTVGGVPLTFHHEVRGSATLEEIAASLAAAINAHPSANLSAEAFGVALVVVNSAANTSGAAFEIQNAASHPAASATATSTTASTTTLSLTGTPALGETWYLQVQIAAGASTVTRTYVHIVALVDEDNNAATPKTVENLSNIATALAVVVNSDVNAASFTALVSDDQIVLVNRAAQVYQASVGVAPAGLESTISIALSGTPVAGQVWSVQLAGQMFFHVVSAADGSVDTLAEIAASLATSINADTNSGFTGVPNGNALNVRLLSGSVVLAGNTVAGSISVALKGTPVAGQTWTLNVNGVPYSYPVASGDNLASIATGLAAAIASASGPGTVANVNSLTITGANSVELVAAGVANIVFPTLDTATVALSGTPAAREVWTLILNGGSAINFHYTVVEGETLADIATGLAEAINAYTLAADDYIATTEGTTVVIARLVAGTFTVGSSFLASNANTPALYHVDGNAATAVTIDLDGIPASGETWTVLLNGQAYNHIATSDETLTDVANALALEISKVDDDFVATVEIDTLVVIKKTAGAFTTAFSITPAATQLGGAATPASILKSTLIGSPFVDDVWTLQINNAVATTYAYTVVAGDTLAGIATALANASNADANAANFTVTVEGNVLVVVNRTGAAFSVTLELLPAGGTAPDDVIALPVTAGKAQSLPVAGAINVDDVWSALLVVDGVASLHTYNVTGGATTLEDIARALAADINANADLQFTAVVHLDDVDPALVSLLVVHRGGSAFSFANSYSINTVTITMTVTAAAIPVSGSPILIAPVSGEVWTIILNDGEATTMLSHVVTAGQSTAQVMGILAAWINTRAPASFIATTDGVKLLIVNRNGRSFTTTVEVTAVGTVSVLESAQRKQPEVGNDYFYGPVNLNIRVNEEEQVDVLNIFHGNSPSDDNGLLTDSTLTGLGMGDNVVISGREIAGGITYFGLETLNLQLGTGNDHFVIDSTHAGATNVSIGAGDDHVEVISISGHTSVQTEAGADTIDVFNADQLVDEINGLLTINGGGDRTDTLSELAEALANEINATQGN
ncbi:MAG TPA: hypothetical protein VK846_02265, partial [Candidatus Limnocylindria bacterium]|nr:hypothetical protein [Candidatus Limnocylindria bacterium]